MIILANSYFARGEAWAMCQARAANTIYLFHQNTAHFSIVGPPATAWICIFGSD